MDFELEDEHDFSDTVDDHVRDCEVSLSFTYFARSCPSPFKTFRIPTAQSKFTKKGKMWSFQVQAISPHREVPAPTASHSSRGCLKSMEGKQQCASYAKRATIRLGATPAHYGNIPRRSTKLTTREFKKRWGQPSQHCPSCCEGRKRLIHLTPSGSKALTEHSSQWLSRTFSPLHRRGQWLHTVQQAHGLEVQLLSRKTIRNCILPALFDSAQSDVKAKVNKADSICLTSDIWTSVNTVGFLALTVHFWDTEEEKLFSATPDCFRIYRSTHCWAA